MGILSDKKEKDLAPEEVEDQIEESEMEGGLFDPEEEFLD
jgi:hypothetical protein